MVKTLKELGIPDYSEEEWFELDDITKFTETLKIRDDGRNLKSRVDPETFYKQNICLDNYLFDGWREALQPVRTERDLFDFMQRIGELDWLIYRRSSTHSGVRPYFTNNFLQYFTTKNEKRDYGNIRRRVASYKKELKVPRPYQTPEDIKDAELLVRSLEILHRMLKEDNFRPLSDYKGEESLSSWDRDRMIYPYHVVLRREHRATRLVLDQ